ncbi:MAG: hypothetical protein RIM72_23535, partial [Alphaproteobacteria bacterium]
MTMPARAGEEFKSFYRQMVRAWPLVALAVLIILATWLIARLVALAVRLLLADRIESPLLLSVVARAFAIPVFLLGIYFVLQFSGLTRLAITVLGGTGLIGIIIGGPVRKFVSGTVSLLNDEPFAEDNSELRFCLGPFSRRSFPFPGCFVE